MSHTASHAPFGARTRLSITLTLLLAVIAGCGGRPLPTAPRAANDGAPAGLAAAASLEPSVFAPDADGGPAFYPLQVGNRWRYDETFFFDGVGDGSPPLVVESTLDVEQTTTERLFDRDYVVEEERVSSPDFSTATSWWRYRQDPSGLFMADIAGNIPPGGLGSDLIVRASGASQGALFRLSRRLARMSADLARSPSERAALHRLSRRLSGGPSLPSPQARPIGVEDDEITRLAFPLRPGQRWTIRSDPRFEATVEGREVLDLPAGRFDGYRVRITSEFFDPVHDRVFFWYGREGLLSVDAHMEYAATDVNGNLIHYLTDMRERLVELELVRRHPDAIAGPDAAGVASME